MNWFRSPIAAAACLSAILIAMLAGVLRFQADQIGAVTLDLMRQRIEGLAIAAAQLVDGDLHYQVVESRDDDGPVYRAAVAPLVVFHNSLPDLVNVYTMTVQNGAAYFVLNTARQSALNVLNRPKASSLMELFDDPGRGDWLVQLASGHAYVTPTPQAGPYGTFLSGYAPILASDGTITGVSGVDIDARTVFQWQNRVDDSYSLVMAGGVLVSVLAGVIVAMLLQRIVEDTRRLERESLTDPLTGAWNRRAFEMRADGDFKRFKRSGGTCSVVVMDIDHFKSINDTFGHDAGDMVLKSVVERTKSMLRETDFVARWGGEEFVSILAETGMNEGVNIADRLRDILSVLEINSPRGEAIEFTVSMGVSEFHSEDESIDDALARADQALYEAKNSGRNRVVSRLRKAA